MIDSRQGSTHRPTIMVIAEDDAAAWPSDAAIAAIGGYMPPRVGFDKAAESLANTGTLNGLMVELQGVGDAAIGDLLARVDMLAKREDLRTVVAFDRHQIDLVAGAMLGRHVELLCDPGPMDRVLALALTRGISYRAHDVRRDEAERLRTLNSEVARIAETLARLSRSAEQTSAGLREAAPDATHTDDSNEAVEAAMVRAAIRARRMRNSFFGADLFADPAWDMLLDLFAAELEFARVSVSSLCIAAAVPGTTALRWISTMLENGVFRRDPDPLDRRRAYISLSEQASEGMRRYFTAIRRAGLASA